MESSKIRESFTSPFRLTMAVDLYLENSTDFGRFKRTSQLYERWLCHCWRTNGASEAEMIQEIGEVMRLAWELHSSGTVQRQVGDLGQYSWFRRCPLRVHDFHSGSWFSFRHKSVQEYLVAAHLLKTLKQSHAEALLSLGFRGQHSVAVERVQRATAADARGPQRSHLRCVLFT